MVALAERERLTNHEREVLELAAEGNTRAEIAAILNITLAGVNKAVEKTFIRLRARNLPHAIKMFYCTD